MHRARTGRQRLRDEQGRDRDHAVDDDRDPGGGAGGDEPGERGELQATDVREHRHRVEEGVDTRERVGRRP